jgi:bifunctional NMN adenylyltransferase/nudix hydrolase
MSLGVIVGRFQTSQLHSGHKALFEIAASENENLLIVLATSENKLSRSNPLDVETRFHMVEEYLEETEDFHKNHIRMQSIQDCKTDLQWSLDLDSIINRINEEAPSEVTLYGGRKSFINSYSGIYKTKNVAKQIAEKRISHNCSASEQRQRDYRIDPKYHDLSFRKGVIYASNMMHPRSFSCVDIALIHENSLYMCSKRGSDKLMFFGGFVDTKDSSFEKAAERELYEESGATTNKMNYICSEKINDFRYNKEEDGVVFTSFYWCNSNKPSHWSPKACDDIEKVHKLSLDSIEEFRDNVDVTHQSLFDSFIKTRKNK